MTGEVADLAALSRLMVEVRPRLHRYCARLVGSVFEGEDVVQDTLAKAVEAFPAVGQLTKAESWLFAIAHNAALDALRRRRRLAEVPLDSDSLELPSESALTSASLEADPWVAATASLTTLMQLPVLQRSTVVLMDVMEYSLAEVVDILSMTLPAVKAALHRGRVRLKTLADCDNSTAPTLNAEERARMLSYAERFNARDFDALRDLLAEDVQLDLVNRLRLIGRKDVSVYFTRYSESTGWSFAPAVAEGRAVLLVSNSADAVANVRYVVLLDWTDGRISGIRDFRYAEYVTDGLKVAKF